MKARDALSRGFEVLRHDPELVLLPLLGDVLLLGLASLGFPAPPVWERINLGRAPTNMSIRAFLPSHLPSVSDLLLPLAPAANPQVGQASPWQAAVTLLVAPVAVALLQSLFLGFLADRLAEQPLSWRKAIRNWPGLAVLGLVIQLSPLLLPTAAGWVVLLPYALIWPLLPFALGVLGMPLSEALWRAPGLLWNRMGVWFRLALIGFTITALFTGFWQLTGCSALVALLLYPALATGLVGAAAALCLMAGQEAQAGETPAEAASPGVTPPPAPVSSSRRPLAASLMAAATFGGWLVLGHTGAHFIDAWSGWLPSREAALNAIYTPDSPVNSLFGNGNTQHHVIKVMPIPQGELVLSRTGEHGLTLSALRRGPFGWKFMVDETWPMEPYSGEPAIADVSVTPDSGGAVYRPRWNVIGEIFDSRVAYLQIGDRRFPIGRDGPVFLVQPGFPPNPPFAFLDAAGQPVPKQEVKRP